MGLGTIATLAREILLARLYGAGLEIEFFRLAFSIPNLLSTSLATVAVGALIPMIARRPDDPVSQSRALQGSFIASMFLAVTLTATGVLTANWQVTLLTPGYSEETRSALLPHVVGLWIFFAVIACSFGPRAFLSARGAIWPMASSSLVLGGVMTVGLIVMSTQPGRFDTASDLVVLAVLAACVLFAVHVAAIPREILLTALRNWRSIEWKELTHSGRLMVMVLIGHLLSATPRLVDRSAATEQINGMVAAMDYSFSIITVPGIALGTVFITAAIPRFMNVLGKHDATGLVQLARRAMGAIAISFVCGFLLSSQSEAIVAVLFAGGEFDSSAVRLTSQLLGWHALGLGPMVASLIAAQAVLAVSLPWAFLLIALLRALSKVLAVKYLVPMYGADGLGASFLVPELVSSILTSLVIWAWYQRWKADPRLCQKG